MAGVADLALGPHQPLAPSSAPARGTRARSRRCVRPARVRRVSATRASSGERRMAAGEDQAQTVVVDAARRRTSSGSSCVAGASTAPSSQLRRPRSAPRRNRSSARLRGRRGQPRAGAERDAVARPALQRAREGVLRTFLGEVPVAGHAGSGSRRRAPIPRGTRRRQPPRRPGRLKSSERPHLDRPELRSQGFLDATSIASSGGHNPSSSAEAALGTSVEWSALERSGPYVARR